MLRSWSRYPLGAFTKRCDRKTRTPSDATAGPAGGGIRLPVRPGRPGRERIVIRVGGSSRQNSSAWSRVSPGSAAGAGFPPPDPTDGPQLERTRGGGVGGIRRRLVTQSERAHRQTSPSSETSKVGPSVPRPCRAGTPLLPSRCGGCGGGGWSGKAPPFTGPRFHEPFPSFKTREQEGFAAARSGPGRGSVRGDDPPPAAEAEALLRRAESQRPEVGRCDSGQAHAHAHARTHARTRT